VAGAEQKLEESEFDSILSGLGASVSEKEQEEVPAQPPTPPSVDSSEFAFTDQPLLKEEAGSAPGETFDFGEFSFAEEPAAAPQQPASAASGVLDFSEFDFDAEPVTTPTEPASAAKDEFDFGDLSFSDEPVLNDRQPAVAEKEALDFGEFSFSEEPAPADSEPAAAEKDAFDFGEVSFGEQALESAEPAVAAADSHDFGEFSFAEEPAFTSEEPQAATEDALDFGEFSFAAEPAVKTEQAAAATEETHDFGDFSFASEPATKGGEPAAAETPLEFGEFSFAEEPPLIAEEPLPAGDLTYAQEPALKAEEEPIEEQESYDFADFSFAPQQPADKQSAAASDDFYYEELKAGQEPAAAVSPASAAKGKAAQETTLDFSFGAKSTAASTSEDEEELPPLGISSRRKGRSWLTVAVVAICVVVILALTGAGLYLLQSGPEALQKFDQVGLGFVGKWFGMESPEEGRITVKNPLAAFYQNKEAGELFVVTGEVVNSYRKPRAAIQVKVSLFDKKGAVLLQKTAYCGNKLSKEQLETLPLAKIDSTMNNQFGDSLANLGVQPGRSIAFVVAIPNVPKEAADFGVQAVGSTVAGQ
jgi:hypothetical protein